MLSTIFFVAATLLLSLNFVRPYGLAISDWLYFGALVSAGFETLTIDRKNIKCWVQNKYIWVVIIILAGSFLSLLNSKNWKAAFIEISEQVFLLIFFVSMIWIFVRRKKINSMIVAFIISGVFASCIVLMDYFTGSNLGPILSGSPDTYYWGRYAGTLGHPNKLGYFLVLTTLLSIGKGLEKQTTTYIFLSRSIWFLLLIIQIMGIYLSGSMTAYMGLLVGLVGIALYGFNRISKNSKALSLASIITPFLLIAMLSAYLILINGDILLSNNLVSAALKRIQNSTAESRLIIYSQAWDQILQNPLVGVGLDQISTSGINADSRFLDYSVHNALLQVWYTGGFFAFLGWLIVYAWVGVLAIGEIRRKNGQTSPVLIASLASAALSIVLMDQFQDAIIQREKWLILGLLTCWVWEMRKTRIGPRYERAV